MTPGWGGRAVRFNLFPKDEQFFDLYGKMAAEIQAASLLLEQLLATDPPDMAKSNPSGMPSIAATR
jgi:hypothetical protein